jgi:hypothetical protein
MPISAALCSFACPQRITTNTPVATSVANLATWPRWHGHVAHGEATDISAFSLRKPARSSG